MVAQNGKQARNDDLQAKLAALKADLEALRNDMKGLAGEAGNGAADHLNESLNEALKTVHELGERAEDWGADHLEKLRQSVREQPLASCVLAMGAGALLWSLLCRR